MNIVTRSTAGWWFYVVHDGWIMLWWMHSIFWRYICETGSHNITHQRQHSFNTVKRRRNFCFNLNEKKKIFKLNFHWGKFFFFSLFFKSQNWLGQFFVDQHMFCVQSNGINWQFVRVPYFVRVFELYYWMNPPTKINVICNVDDVILMIS